MAVKVVRRRATKPKKATRRARRVTKKMQTGTMRRVWNGTAKYTRGGLMKKDLCLNKRGKVVSRRALLGGKRAYKAIRAWTTALGLARKQLGIKGFVPCRKGTMLYKKTMAIYKKK